MVKIREAIVVEGRYDKNILSQLVEAPIFQTNGFGIMNDKEQLELLRCVAQKRGLVIFTDSDGAGFVIRNFLKGAISNEYLKHAYIPEITGKEKRKAAPGKEGLLGVEGMTPQVILECLANAGVTFEGQDFAPPSDRITKQDFVEFGLSGGKNSKILRIALLTRLGLPRHMSANALLQAVNVLYSKDEIFKIVQQIGEVE